MERMGTRRSRPPGSTYTPCLTPTRRTSMPSLASPIDAGEPVQGPEERALLPGFQRSNRLLVGASGAAHGPGLLLALPRFPPSTSGGTSGSVPTGQTGASRYPRAATLSRTGVVAAGLTRRRRAAVGTTHQGLASGPALRTDETTSRIA